MRTTAVAVLVLAAGASLACSSSHDSSENQPHHPALDKDYTSNFVGSWYGTFTLTMNGQTQTGSGYQPISRTGFNTLALAEMCSGIAGNAGLDSATTFSMDPLTCPPVPQPCGPVTIAYKTGNGSLAGGTLTFSLTGTASGCGRSFDFTGSFNGTLPPAVLAAADTAIATFGSTMSGTWWEQVTVTADESQAARP